MSPSGPRSRQRLRAQGLDFQCQCFSTSLGYLILGPHFLGDGGGEDTVIHMHIHIEINKDIDVDIHLSPQVSFGRSLVSLCDAKRLGVGP